MVHLIMVAIIGYFERRLMFLVLDIFNRYFVMMLYPLRFPHETMLGSFLPPVDGRRAHVLFTLILFVCTQWCPIHIMLCFCFVFRRLVCINVNEYPRGNQKWTIQRNWQHRVHKTNFSGLPIRYSLITFIYNRQYGNWLCLSASNATRLRFYYQKWKIYNGKITIITIVLNKIVPL